jgi:outer membrane protein OmpA-like peptidoglycan-associated protein
MKRLKYAFILFLLVFVTSGNVIAADCKLAQDHFEKGLEAGKKEDYTAAKSWLNKSVALCNKFENWYLLGRTEQHLKDSAAASSAFEDARRYAKTNDERALAIARYAEVQSSQGQVAEPLTLLHQARKMHSSTPQWITDLAKSLDIKRTKQPLTVAMVTRALNNRSLKLLDVETKPSINVTVNFKYNSVDVTDESKKNIDVLARALQDASFAGKTITIVGHSDARGAEEYNQGLSEKRALAIAQQIAEKIPGIGDRLQVSGFGESQPLYEGKSEDVYLLNRRIEVQVD